MSEMAMPEGVIVGGWSYVVAAYAITGVVFAGYAWSLLRRNRAERSEGEESK